MKDFDIKFKVISENTISIRAKNKAEAIEKAMELFNNSSFKDLNVNNLTKHYYLIDIDKKTILKKNKGGE